MPVTPKDRQLMELKDTITQLNRTVQEQTKAIASLTAMLDEEKAGKASVEAEKTLLLEQIEYLKKKLFGTSSEKTGHQVEGQVSLFNEAEAEAADTPEAEKEEEAAVREHKRRPKRKLKEKLKGISVEEAVIELPEEERSCPECGTEMKPIGKEFVRREFEYIPASGKVKEIYRMVYACPECREHAGEEKEGEENAERKCVIVKPDAGQGLLPHSIASPSSAAWAMYQKYVNAVPLYRQEKDWGQLGLELSRTTMANWIIRCAEEYLRPVFEHLHRTLLARGFLMADETRVQVLKEPGRKAQTDSFMWVFRTGEDGEAPIILFRYTQTRSGDHAASFLAGFEGYLEADGYPGYNSVRGIKRCGCWAHLRRYFVEAVPKGKASDLSVPAVQGVQYCSKLFRLEAEISSRCGTDYEKKKKQRILKEKPILEAFWLWLEKQSSVKNSRFDKAVTYAMNQKPYMETYLEDGRCSFSNNLSEQEMKNFVIGRKNWLFADSPKGAEASSIVYSIVETAKANRLNIFRYLRFLLEKRPSSLMTDEELAKLTPWDPDVVSACSVK